MSRNPEERRRQIQALLASGGVAVASLAERLGVSEITIRRDLASLAASGRALRVHGGAMPGGRVSYEFSFKEKESRHREEKEAIGRAAAALAPEGGTMFLDTGTTTLALARALRGGWRGVIVTINLCVASEFVGQRGVRVLAPGGEVNPLSPDLMGEWALERLASVSVDVAFFGCDAVDPGEGFYAADTKAAAITRLMLGRAERRVLLADASKFGRRSLCRIAGLDRLTDVVTCGGLDAGQRRAMERRGVRVTVAEVAAGGGR